jgi:N-acyl homoserine lactone hydrolase
MSRALRIWPLLTGTQRYEKSVSTRNRGRGTYIDAPILAYLIETPNGRILYDAGCDYRKIATPNLRARYFDPGRPTYEPPKMSEEQRIPRYLARLGLQAKDIDIIFLGHLHWDHVGGLCELPGCEVHVQRAELAAAQTRLDPRSSTMKSSRARNGGSRRKSTRSRAACMRSRVPVTRRVTCPCSSSCRTAVR